MSVIKYLLEIVLLFLGISNALISLRSAENSVLLAVFSASCLSLAIPLLAH